MSLHTYTPARKNLDELLTELEAAIAALRLDGTVHDCVQITMLDEGQGAGGDLPSEVFIGATIDCPGTRDTDQLSDENTQWLEDTVVVRLLMRSLGGVSPDGRPARYRESSRARAALEKLVAWQLMNSCSEQRIRRTGSVRSHNPSSGTLTSVLTFTNRRFEAEPAEEEE